MNLTARRLATAAAGVAIAASAVAVSGPAAVAAKPGGGASAPKPLTLEAFTDWEWNFNTYVTGISYDVPEAGRNVQQTTCWLDAQPTECSPAQNTLSRESPAQFTVWMDTPVGEHTYTVQVTTRKATYSGSVTFTGIAG